MKILHLVIAGLLTVLAVSAISTPGKTSPVATQLVNDIPFFTVPRQVVCAKTDDMKKELKPFESVWAGVNRNDETDEITSIVELLTLNEKWVTVEHFTEGVSCVTGVGEEWSFNPKHKRGIGVSI